MKFPLFPFFLLGAAALSFWLLISGWDDLPGCGPQGGCDLVQNSRWARVFGVPVAALGGSFYLILALRGLAGRERMSARGVRLEVLGAWFVLLAAVYFVGLQAIVLGNFCPLCLLIHSLAGVGALLLLCRRRPFGVFKPAMVGLACVGVGLFGALQFLGPQPGRSEVLSLQAPGQGEETQGLLLRPFFDLQGQGQVALDGGEVPAGEEALPQLRFGTGEGAMPLQVALLTDWTCPDCLVMHAALRKLYEGAGGDDLPDLEVVMLPLFFDEEGEQLHRVMLRVHALSAGGDTFRRLIEEMLGGGLKIDPTAVRERAFALEPRLATQWQEKEGELEPREDHAFSLGQRQMVLHADRLGAVGIPQLTVLDALLTGAPSLDELESFLRAAVERQSAFLETPAGKLRTDGRPGCLCRQSSHVHARPGQPVPASLPLAKPEDEAPPGPRLKFDSVRVTTEPVAMGEAATGVFHFVNAGDEPLTIKNVHGGCRCVAIEGGTQTLAPGERGSFSVTYDSKGRAAAGITHVRQIWVRSNSVTRTNPSYGDRVVIVIPFTSG